MKYFVVAFLLTSVCFSKNKVLFIEKSNNPKIPPNFIAINDFKKPSSKKIIDASIDSYASNDDFIVYLKNSSLYIITDFETYNKILISDSVSEYKIRKGMLFYSRVINNTVTLFAITDFKTLTKQEVVSNYISYNIDEP